MQYDFVSFKDLKSPKSVRECKQWYIHEDSTTARGRRLEIWRICNLPTVMQAAGGAEDASPLFVWV